jgi:two-component system OmpR family sensor kinase
MRRLSRLSVRVRVTLAVTVVMAVVLAATGLFLYARLAAELDATVDRGLRVRAGDVAALVQHRAPSLTASGRSALTEEGENLAQVLDASGAIVDATPTFRTVSFLTAGELARARRGTLLLDDREVPGEGEAVRLLATPVTARGQTFVVVVGAPLEDRRDALRNLAGLLLLGGPVALLLASIAGYGAAAAALRPVERMRLQAAAIQAGRPSARLPVSPADDEIGRLGQTLNAMLARLEEAFDRERTFVSDASHELRTPLAILKAELELALRGGLTSAELEAALASAADETDRLVQLAEDLLVIARSDRGRLPIRVTSVAVRGLLEQVCRRFERRAVDAGANLLVRAPADLRVDADPLRLEQAVGNLVDNALRYGGTTIELTARVAGQSVQLLVVDDGPGFPAAFVDTAFERFTRADSARGRGGSGLGLAIVCVIAGAHGGTASARNNAAPERGAELSLCLPTGDATPG